MIVPLYELVLAGNRRKRVCFRCRDLARSIAFRHNRRFVDNGYVGQGRCEGAKCRWSEPMPEQVRHSAERLAADGIGTVADLEALDETNI